MKIGIDVDGVLADFVDACQREVSTFSDKKLDTSSWGLGLTDEEQTQFWNIVKTSPDWWLRLHPLEDARTLLAYLVSHPHAEIFYVTSRIESNGFPVMHQTQMWLARFNLLRVGTSVIVKPSKVPKLDIYNAIGVESAIDDYLPACGGIIQVLDRPWNQPKGENDEQIKRIYSLKEFLDGLV